MSAEAVRYINDEPALDDGLQADLQRLVCGECDAEYRVQYSSSESGRLDDHRYLAAERNNRRTPHPLAHHPGLKAVREFGHTAACSISRQN
jgi:hypothetical protein